MANGAGKTKVDRNPRVGTCLCGGPATIFDTKNPDRLSFRCHKVNPLGFTMHFGFVMVEDQVALGQPPLEGTVGTTNRNRTEDARQPGAALGGSGGGEAGDDESGPAGPFGLGASPGDSPE